LNELKQSKNEKDMVVQRFRDQVAEIGNFQGLYCEKTGAYT
jgi:hypothetical protein